MRITKREVIVAGLGFVLAVVLGGAGLWWHSRNKQSDAAKQTVSQQADQTSSGLSVSTGSASSLGQLSGDQSKNGSNASSDNKGPDTSSFAQYDKYKDSKDALFGEIQKGTGADLTAGKKASVVYKGWLTNGALIDQSPVAANGQPQPFSFTMGSHEVIPGWEEGMYGMKAGGTRLIIIPPAVGYGAQGKGAVPPNAVLVFQVQLLSVQ